MAAGRFHSLALLSPSGRVCAWGLSADGQLGPVVDRDGLRLRTTAGAGLTAAPCFSLLHADGSALIGSAISAGASHSVVVTRDGRLFAWGCGVAARGSNLDTHVPIAPLEGVLT